MSSLAALAALVRGLPARSVGQLHTAACAAALLHLRALAGGHRGTSLLLLQQQQQYQLLGGARRMTAQAQQHEDEDAAAAPLGGLGPAASAWQQLRPDAAPAGAAAATAAAPLDDAQFSGEGEVSYPEGALLRSIQAHWEALKACPSAAAYTQRVTFDEFGARYIQQMEREEAARSRALAQLQREADAAARSGQPLRTGGGVASRLLSAWLPLLQQAVEEEQQQVLAGGARSGLRRDRPNYGPYLLLLGAEDLAHITLQTVLSRVATALPGADEQDAAGASGPWAPGWSGAGGGWPPAGGAPDGGGGGGGAAGGGVMCPAVVLADAVGRAVNGRVKYLRHKHHQRQWDERQRAALRELARAADAEAAAAAAAAAAEGERPGGELAAGLRRYSRHNSAEAAQYEAGQARLAAFAELRSIRAAERKAAKAARAELHWGQEARIKVGAALLALLVENTTLPAGLPGGRSRAWPSPSSSSPSQKASPSPAAAAAAAAAPSQGGGGGAAEVPAFEYLYLKAGLKQQTHVRASSALVGVLLADRSLAASLLAKVPPMLVPPLPWSSYCTGGYLTSRHWMMRTRHSRAVQEDLRRGMETNQYGQVLDALNVLGNTAWRINRRVFDALTALWAARSTAGGLPAQVPHRPPPPPHAGYRLLAEGGGLLARGGPPSRAERRAHVLASDDVRRLNRNMASLKADFLLKLKVAEEFADAPEFYYPHTLDFRGRAYPLHPSLHHLGDDACRGLLSFARGVPLGPQGLDWLYVHLANVWGQGQDKAPFDGRRAFARSHLPDILASAADPLRHTWWQGAEKPWQALAACGEISAALESMDPASFVSCLPVHMDGSCNGLQHYAALGRDEAGGRAVNLLPSDRPQDVYKGVAEIVSRRVAAAAAAGSPEALRCAALVDRKLVKQTVMTSVYGVTPVGARAQVEARLRERRADMRARAALLQRQPPAAAGAAGEAARGWLAQAGVVAGGGGGGGDGAGGSGAAGGGLRDEYGWLDDRDVVWQVSKYLADLTLDAIGEMFGAARSIMGWLADCARLAAAEDAPVRWTSPLGLPITQPYHRLALAHVSTATQSFSVVPSEPGGSGGGGGSPPQWLKGRQRSAFPPNFIHSVDSTHMMMTALACSRVGVEFAGVHDSFWCHAGHVPTMNKLLREKFVELHTRQPDLLEDLLSQLQRAHPHVDFPPIPERGRLAVGRVCSSRYFFS